MIICVFSKWISRVEDFSHIILFENLFKPRQLPSATSKQYFEQPVASFLVCALIFIEYKGKYSEL
ncbi:TPA: hypothetical protein ACL67K_001185, partial [Streptococcus pneumoniae]